MKNKLLTILALLSFLFGYSQTWTSVGSGIPAGGYVRTLYVYDSVLYAGGYFNSPGRSIAQWNDTTWDSLSSGINGEVYAIGTYKGDIYIGGYFSRAGDHSAGCIAKWDGSSFSETGFSFQSGEVDAIQSYDSLLYIGGRFDSTNHLHYPGLISWNGNKIDSVHSTLWDNVSVMTTYNNLLVFGFGPLGGDQPVVTWNNKKIDYLPSNPIIYFAGPPWSPFQFKSFEQNTFCQKDSNLYVGGCFSYFFNWPSSKSYDTVNNIAMFDGKQWNKVGTGINGIVYALATYKNLIIAAGSFDSTGRIPANNIAAWDGTKWEALGDFNGPVYALAVYDSNLYAGGNFSSPANGIAEYHYVPQPAQLGDATLFPNPNSGVFTIQLSSIGIPLTVKIYNMLGQIIYSATSTNSTISIDLSKEYPGGYIYSIMAPDGKIMNSGKFVIE